MRLQSQRKLNSLAKQGGERRRKKEAQADARRCSLSAVSSSSDATSQVSCTLVCVIWLSGLEIYETSTLGHFQQAFDVITAGSMKALFFFFFNGSVKCKRFCNADCKAQSYRSGHESCACTYFPCGNFKL